MGTSYLPLPVQEALFPDNSTNNAAPAFGPIKGTNGPPARFLPAVKFDPTTDEYMWFTFRMPGDYSSAPVLKLQWMANTTSGSVVWAASIGAVTPGDADTPLEHAQAAASTATTSVNTTEARRLVETSLTLANTDSLAAGDLVSLLVYRNAGNGSDTCTVDAELSTVELSYTTT